MSKELLKNLKILCVEDENNISRLLKDALGEYFYSFIIAKDGLEGIEKYNKISPDIVISDIMMPKLNGLEMTKRIRQEDEDLPIIILSAYSDKDKLLKAIDLGINKYFIKPFNPEELLDYLFSLAKKLNKNKIVKLNKYFTFDMNSKNLFENNNLVKLTKREREFIFLLIKNKKEFVSNELMGKHLWEEEIISLERIRTFIKRLRQKTSKELIKNISGQGYLISKDNI